MRTPCMQTYWKWLDQTIAARIDSGEIGKPLFVRADLQLTADHGHLLGAAGAVLESVTRWFQSGVDRVYAHGGVRQGFLSLMVEFSGGQTALLSAETTRSGDPSALVLVLGQYGSIRLDDYPEPEQLGDAARANPAIVAAIERSLDSGRPAGFAKE